MNQSRTKSKVVIIALSVIVLVLLALVLSVVEIRKIYVYNQRIDKQEREITDLNNAKDYYKDQLNKHPAGSNDKVFEE